MWRALTPLDFYRRSRRLFGDKVGVVDRDRRFTFAQLAERTERLAGALRAAGLRPRAAVSVLSANAYALLEAFYGVPLAGGVVHPVNPRLAPLEIAALVNDAGSRILIFEGSLAPVVREVLGNLKAVEQLVVVEGDPRALDFPAVEYEELLAGAEPHAPELGDLEEDAPLALFHTSGGAVRPRGVLLSHRTLALHALYAVIAMGLREEDVSLCSVPFSYMNGGGNPQANVAVAATSVLARRNDPETLLGLIARERVTVWITAPAALGRLLASPRLTPTACESLRLVLVGGASVPEATVRAAEERLGARCVSVYGLTETSPFITAAFPKHGLPRDAWPACQATAGLPVLGVEVAVVDEDGREVAQDGETPGEILVRGNGVMTGYARDPEATQQALKGGWLHTGDLATVDAAGYLTLRGRKTDEILIGGMRVSAREIEAALASHPDVAQCGVIAASDPERGEAPVGVVVLRAGAKASEADLVRHVAARLARFKVPRRIEFVSALPTTEAGEVVKSELRTLYAS